MRSDWSFANALMLGRETMHGEQHTLVTVEALDHSMVSGSILHPHQFLVRLYRIRVFLASFTFPELSSWCQDTPSSASCRDCWQSCDSGSAVLCTRGTLFCRGGAKSQGPVCYGNAGATQKSLSLQIRQYRQQEQFALPPPIPYSNQLFPIGTSRRNRSVSSRMLK